MKKNIKLPFSFAPIDTPKARKIIYVLAVIAVVAAYFLLVRPNLDQEKMLQAETEEVIQQVTKERQDLETLKKVQENEGSKAKQLGQRILVALPLQVQNEIELNRLNRLADHTGTRISSYTFGASSEVEGVNKKTITLNVSGGYEGLLRFMSGLQNQTRMVGKSRRLDAVGPIWSLDSVNLSKEALTAAGEDPNSSGGGRKEMTLTINGSLYLSPSQAPPTATPTDPNQPTTQTQ